MPKSCRTFVSSALDLDMEVELLTVGSAPAMAGVGGMNEARLLDRFMGDAELLRGVAKIFLESEPALRSRLAAALSSSNGMDVSRAAHSLMGSVGNFGAEKAMALAGELELMGEGNNLSGAGKVLESLVEALDDLRSQLNGLTQAHPVGEAGTATVS